MIKKLLLFFSALSGITFSQPYPDQFYSYRNENLIGNIESMSGMEITPDEKSVILSAGETEGSVIFEADSSEYPFNRGLPSWNGHAEGDNSSFKVSMRFYNNSWSPWLTVGYWKENIWTSYGSVSYSGGEIEVDYAVLNSYHSKWQFQIIVKRTDSSVPAPSLHKLSFFVSDQVTTNNVNIQSLVNDNPEAIFIDTEHIWQNSVDEDSGGSMCSPTSVSMVLRSYNIEVDPLQFARATFDPYHHMFGVWPRVVQNAAEYGLNGAVKRYRTWSEAREILSLGGRVVMSVGSPLYPNGHLMMLAGFDAAGDPIVHDPARSDGYSFMHDKTELSQSWFNKGGIAYTFFPEDTTGSTSVEKSEIQLADGFHLTVFPNPFNPQTNIRIETLERNHTEITIYDIRGREVEKILKDVIEPGSHNFNWNASDLPSGMYFIHTISGNHKKSIKALLVK